MDFLNLNKQLRYKKVMANFMWRLKRHRVESKIIKVDIALDYEAMMEALVDNNPWLKQVPRRLIQPITTTAILENYDNVEIKHQPQPKKDIKANEQQDTTTSRSKASGPDSAGTQTDDTKG